MYFVMNETETIKNTPALIGFGLFFIIFFGWWLIRRYRSFNFDRRLALLDFLFDNYLLIGAVLLGLFFLLLAVIV